jgi:hypothetical protein
MHRLLLAAVVAVVPAAAFGQGAHDNIDALIEQQAKANGVPASFVHAVVKRESNYNPRAKGGSALGLMQIKHATARSLGYTGDAAGLYDPETNLRYGVAYLAGAYRTAQGNLAKAYGYYNRGYYYAAKRQGISTEVASVVAPVAASASALASLFSGGVADSRSTAASALAYAPTAATVAEVPTETVEVPLPPRRPATLGGATIQLASLTVDPAAPASTSASAAPATAAAQAAAAPAVEVPLPPRRPTGLGSAAAAPAQIAELRLTPQADAASAPMTPAAASETVAEAVEVPLPPRRPSVQMLAAAAPRRAVATAPLREATALPVE